MLAELIAAMAFLTRIPVGGWRAGDTWTRTSGSAAFGVVGALVGLIGSIPLLLLGERAPLAAAVLAVAAVALVSGALHLDGLADTVDALAAPSGEAADRARKDPRVGAAGAAAITLVILADAALLAAVVELRSATAAAVACIVAAAGSRAVAPAAAWLNRRSPAGPPLQQRGLGARFVARASMLPAAVSWLTALLVAAAAATVGPTPQIIVAAVAGTLVGIGLSRWLRVARGRLDGDGFGFLVEVSFVAILLVSVVTL